MLRIEETSDPKWFLKSEKPLLVGDVEDYPEAGLPIAVEESLSKLRTSPKWTPGALKVLETDGRIFVLCCTHAREAAPTYSSVSLVLQKIRDVREKLGINVLATPPLGMGLGSDEINWSVMEDMIKIWFGGAMSASASGDRRVQISKAPEDFLLELWKYMK